MSAPVTPVIATMVGVASSTSTTAAGDAPGAPPQRRALGRAIEAAMAAEVHKISEESTAIWNDLSLPEDERRRRIAAFNSDDNKRTRMLAARDLVKSGHRAAVATQHAQTEVERLEAELAAARARAAAAAQQ